MYKQSNWILAELLDCGLCDLQMLEKVECDVTGIIQAFVENTSGLPTLNDVINEIFEIGKDEMKIALKESNTRTNLDVENDVTWYTNYLDSYIGLRNYDKYVDVLGKDKLKEIEHYIGFEFDKLL